MNRAQTFFYVSLIALAVGIGCDTTGSSGSSTMIYYGVGHYDPWYYYGDYDDHHHHHDGDNIIINPPPGGGDWDSPRPSHPIAGDRPSMGNRPSVSPRPSIPSTPRPAARSRRR